MIALLKAIRTLPAEDWRRAAGLAALVVWRRRIMKLGPGRPLLTIVAALALVHVSVQVLLFVRELAF